MPSREPSADESPAHPVSPDEGASPVSETKSGSSSGFQLDPDGPRIVGSRVRYPRTMAEYAKVYGDVDEKTVKRWVARGRAADDLPPLHRPALMPDWFSRRMERAVPEAILLAASEANLSASPPTPEPVLKSEPAALDSHTPPADPVPKVPETTPPGETPPPPRDFSKVKGMSFEENVENLRRQLAIQSKLMEEAMTGQDNGLMASRQRSYRDTMAELRKAESDLIKWQEENGDLARLTEVRAENNRIASTIFNAVMRLVKNVRPQLAGKSPAEQDRIWQQETLTCFSILKGAKFTKFEASCP